MSLFTMRPAHSSGVAAFGRIVGGGSDDLSSDPHPATSSARQKRRATNLITLM
jgi:hypothetical protein